MDMNKWLENQIASDRKKALPVLSFPAIQMMGVTVKDLIASPECQAEAMKKIAERFDTAASVSFMDLSVEAEAFGSKVVVSDTEVPTVIGSLVGEDDDPEALEIPKVGAGRTQNYIEAIRIASKCIDDRPVFAGIIGPFSLAGRLMDVQNAMIMAYEEPEFVQVVLGKVTTFLIDYAKAFKEAGADGIVMAEPLAGLLELDLIDDFSSKYVKQIVDEVQDDSFAVIYHNCGGGVTKMMDSINAIGAKGYHFGNAIDMADVLPQAPSDVVVMGNIDPADVLRNGEPDSIRTATTEILEKCSKYPNFIVSSGCDIPPMTPFENLDAFFAAVSDYYKD